MSEKYVFISYSSKDERNAQSLCRFLGEHNIKFWIAPQSLHPGEDYPAQIIEGIRNCSAFVLLASRNTNLSAHVENEVASAFDAGKPLIAYRLENVDFTDEYIYYLKRKHWIDAFSDIENGPKQLLETLNSIFTPQNSGYFREKPRMNVYEGESNIEKSDYAGTANNYGGFGAGMNAKESAPKKDELSVVKINDASEMISFLKSNAEKYPYSLSERIAERGYEAITSDAEIIFENTVKVSSCGKPLDCKDGYVNFAVEKFLRERGVAMYVMGLPGTAKNMLLQLVFYKLLTEFEQGKSDCLPVYVSIGYYERQVLNSRDPSADMNANIRKDLLPFVEFVKNNKNIRPLVLVEGVREYVSAKFSADAVIARVLEPLGRFDRMIAVDSGLIKNKQRLKKFIPLAGDMRNGYFFRFEGVDVEESERALKLIDGVCRLYDYSLDRSSLLSAIADFKYPQVDIYVVRLIAKEVFSSYNSGDKSISDIYENMALTELCDEEKLFDVSKKAFEYVFADRNAVISFDEYDGKTWSFANKHHTCLEFLLAYYFVHCIERFHENKDYSFFKMMLTSMASQFVVSMLKDNYELQITLYEFISSKYEIFDARQKSNAAYWLGRINYNKNLTNQALTFLTSHFTKLKTLVKTNNKNTQENLDNHFVFRAVCTAMLFHGQANMMDEYLCIVITNDVANAINRGATVEYFGNDYQMCAFNEYYLDTDLSRGESALRMLNNRIEKALYGRDGKFVESNLVTFLTLLQARIQSKSQKLCYDVKHYVSKAIEYLNAYKFKPQNIASGKILFYLDGVKEDLELYLNGGAFDIGPMLYNRCKNMKNVKRIEWVKRDIEDPESVAEHVFSSWLLAMLFLPEESKYDGYNKKEILDMLLIHDMAQTVRGEGEKGVLVTRQLDLQDENVIVRKFFLKGTYPDIANLTYYYNVWTGYYNNLNINAKIARDVNLIQAIYTFCEYYSKFPNNFTPDDLREWKNKKAKIVTEIGYDIYNRMIVYNSDFSDFIN